VQFRQPRFPTYRNGFPILRPDKVLVHFLRNFSWGGSTFIQSETTNILVDLSYMAGTDITIQYLQDLNISHLDLIVLTHPHIDHIAYNQGGLQKFLDNFSIGKVWSSGHPEPVWYDGVTPCPFDLESRQAYQLVLSQMFPTGYTTRGQGQVPGIDGTSRIPYHEPRAQTQPEVHNIGNITLNVLHPGNTLTSPHLNPDSIVFQVVYGASRVMLTGDAFVSSENTMLSKFAPSVLKSDVLCLGHHGLNDATSEAWLDAVDPSLAVVQQGEQDVTAQRIKAELQTRDIPLYNPFLEERTVVFEMDGNSTHLLEPVEDFNYTWQNPIF